MWDYSNPILRRQNFMHTKYICNTIIKIKITTNHDAASRYSINCMRM